MQISRASSANLTNLASLKDFLISALQQGQRLDGRRPFECRHLSVKFPREDGTAEVQLGQTHVISVVSCQLVPPHPDRPSEGTFVVFTDFSPMSDPAFEAGRATESFIELGRIIERGLRESRAVDTESLCILAGKAVWSLRIDICILDNGGNIIDAAGISALASLLSFRRPECTIRGTEYADIDIHPPEIREPVPLIIHYLPISFTFGFFADGDLVVMDPTYKEELLMSSRLTVILNTHGDICAIQKGGGVGVRFSDIMQCLQVASQKLGGIVTTLKKAVEAHDMRRGQRNVKMHRSTGTIKEGFVPMTMNDGLEGGQVMLDTTFDSDSLSDGSGDSEVEEKPRSKIMSFGKGKRIPGKSLLQVSQDRTSSTALASVSLKHTSGKHADSSLELKANELIKQLQKIDIPESKDKSIMVQPRKDKPVSLLDAVKRNNLKKRQV